MKRECILVFGAGELQTSIISTARRRGLYTIALDPSQKAVGKDLADVFYVVQGNDYESTLEIAIKHGVSGVVTAATDKPLLMMSRIAQKLNLPFPSSQALLKSTRKDLMKETFQRHKLPCAQGMLLESEQIISDSILEKLKFPVIVKPVDNSGSRGVTLNHTIQELKESIKVARLFSPLGKILIEEYIPGPEFSVESIITNDKVKILQITDKITTKPPYNVEMGHIQPTYLDNKEQLKIKRIVNKAIRALELDNCACHTELKLSPKGPVIIENGPRLGGDYITSQLVPLSTGIDMEEAVIDIAIGRKPNLKSRFNKGAAVLYLELSPGIVQELNNWDDVFKLPGVVQAKIVLEKGIEIPKITNSLDRYGFVIANGEKRDVALSNAKDAILALSNCIHIQS